MDKVSPCPRHHKSKGHIEVGMAFIVLGIVFLLHQTNLLRFELHWYVIATIAFVTMGIAEIAQFKRPHKIFEGLTKMALGAWFYISFSGQWGFSPATTWPIVLIIMGTGLVFKSLFKNPAEPNQPQSKGE